MSCGVVQVSLVGLKLVTVDGSKLSGSEERGRSSSNGKHITVGLKSRV